MKSKNINKPQTLIRFDWAMKRLLRQKANYAVLEGFLSVLLQEDVAILNINESESNQASAVDKFNRVDILVENKQGELLIIEIQNSEEVDYFLRMLYGVSKTISEHISSGEPYSKIRKVYHINIVYFKLGQGKDYVYNGTTEFRGIHRHDVLQLTDEQKVFFAANNRENVCEVKDLFPEYYILCVEDFNDVAKDNLDEWIYFFKNNRIPDEFKAPGLEEARKRLQYDSLSEQEKRDYEHHLNQRLYEKGSIDTAIRKGEAKGMAKGLAKGLVKGEAKGLAKGLVEGEAKGLAKGLVEGEAKGLVEGEAKGRAAERTEVQESMVINCHNEGMSVEIISKISGLTPEQITEIINRLT